MAQPHDMAWCCRSTGYARRGLRSAIASAVKDGITVEEVMHPDPDTFGSGAVKGAGAAAAAAVGRDWASVAREFEEVDAAWAASKSGRASECTAGTSLLSGLWQLQAD